MLLGVTMANQSPDQKANARDHQHAADNVALLCLDLLLELEADERDHATQHDRCEHVTAGGQGCDPREPGQAPMLRTSNYGQWHPMVREYRVDYCDGGRADDEQKNWR